MMVALNIVIGQGASLGWMSGTVVTLTIVFLASVVLFFRIELGNPNGFSDLGLFGNRTFSGATLSNCLLNGAAGTLLVVLTLVQEAAGLSSLQSGLLTVGYLVWKARQPAGLLRFTPLHEEGGSSEARRAGKSRSSPAPRSGLTLPTLTASPSVPPIKGGT